MRKAGNYSLRITHDKFKTFNSSTSAKKVPPPDKVLFDASFEHARAQNVEVDKHIKKAMDDLNPLRVLKLFRQMKLPDLELLGLKNIKPETFLWQHVPAPPVCIRPSVGQEGASTEDDITAKLGDIIAANSQLRESLLRGVPVSNLADHWDFLSLQIAMYVNSDVPGLQKAEYGKQIRGFVQRLKGKQGRFRGNLSGKRVDFTARTVISPDPNLAIDEVAVPILVAKNLTYPEKVTKHNITKLRIRIQNGHRSWPGANYVYPAGEAFRLFLKFGDLSHIADRLKEGDVVERHLEDGDIVLFNRQPSLHKLSILAHRVRVRPYRTFRLNECDCTPYNADFDGDEMNLHVPQTEEARAEATELMGVKHNIVTPKNGEPIISAIQDFVTASFLLSSLDKFYDRKTFTTTCISMLEPDTNFDLPPPTVLKPQMLWTGKQVFNILMRPNRRSEVKVNIDAQCRDFKQYYSGLHNDLQNDSCLCIRNSEVMCGRMDKSTIGAGKKHSLFYIMYRDFGPDVAAQGMNRLSRLCGRWLTNEAFSVGIDDVTPSHVLAEAKKNTIDRVLDTCDRLTRDSRAGRLKRRAGLDDSATLEQEQVKVLSTVRTDIAGVLTSQLSRKNSPMIMASSGAKGSNINVAQMAALLGQQDIEGKRVADGFQDRTLPHFAKLERDPPSKGFVSNSFYSGLNPSEFFFHAVGGRVGLVDTAVKTADTGYMSRRLMKSLEDLSVQHDRTVRSSYANVVQFRFGDDDLDPVDMEASARPVDLDRTFAHIQSSTYNAEDPGLSSTEIFKSVDDHLSQRSATDLRTSLTTGNLFANLNDPSFAAERDSKHLFVESVRDFLRVKASALAELKAQKQPFRGSIADSIIPSAILRKSKRKSDVMVEEDNHETFTTPTRSTSRRIGPNAVLSSIVPTSSAKKRKSARTLTQEIIKTAPEPSTKDRFELTYKISESTLGAFVRSCLSKYERARVEPGHAVGAVGAQSIGEPGTQMTLKTFHFAGVAGMSLTAGVPRIKEIINASKTISTPIITCRLERRSDLSIPESFARIVKGRIEKLCLGDITSYIQISHALSRPSSLSIRISLDAISELGLDITIREICSRIKSHKKFKGAQLKIVVKGEAEIKLSVEAPLRVGKRGPGDKDDSLINERLLRLQLLRRFLPTIQILGYPHATRAVVMAEDDPISDQIEARRDQMRSAINPPHDGKEKTVIPTAEAKAEELRLGSSMSGAGRKAIKSRNKNVGSQAADRPEPVIKVEDDNEVASSLPSKTISSARHIQSHKIIVSGYGLKSCISTPGVDPYRTQTNSIIETYHVLGIEAARLKIISEINEVTKDLSIDPRHIMLLADTMTYRGEVLGITRFGLAKTGDSVLRLASFEKTADHVFDAAARGKVEEILGVSECVIVGKTMGMGTGCVDIVRGISWGPDGLRRERTVFEEAWEGR